ncbi:hypothetical protein [Myxococcus sp. AM011]|uniref:hypothetical protein n=1 Tax=Myxococcus sp. AM011 TaxID=2745200 RepID=UPI001C3DCBE5|nr:hypothetical protein [Myxococcus sp. AM011]
MGNVHGEPELHVHGPMERVAPAAESDGTGSSSDVVRADGLAIDEITGKAYSLGSPSTLSQA